MKKLLKHIPDKLIIPLIIVLGMFFGLAAYAAYMSRAHSYLQDDPAACTNCHVMATYYQSWNKSSHRQWATCNDCHTPNDNIISQYAFKAMDGLRHATVFTFRAEPQVMRPNDGSSAVIMQNCIRCHEPLNTQFVNTGLMTFNDVKHGEGKACWDCHREVPHTRISGLASTALPTSGVPLPVPQSQKPNVPVWLQQALQK